VAEDGSSQAYDVVELTIGCTGQWTDVIDFCRRINNLDRGTRVTVMTFTYVPETEDVDAYIDVSGTIQVYVMAAASNAAPDGQ
jgi:Tfp pilus assembly protein PilO